MLRVDSTKAIEDLRDELKPFGLLFIRKFSSHGANSAKKDYLVIFDQDAVEMITPKETWASTVISTPSQETSSPVTVVASATVSKKPEPFTLTHHGKRPGRRVREMVKALHEATQSSLEPEPAPTPVEPKPTPSTPKLPSNLRPFRVAVSAPPSQFLSLVHPDKEAAVHWLQQVVHTLVRGGILEHSEHCQVHITSNQLQCRFSSSVSSGAKNAVFAILRSAVWFQSLATDTYDQKDQQPHLVQCTWQQRVTL